MNFDDLLIRCSAIGKIKTLPKEKAARERGDFGDTCKTYLSEVYRELKYSRKKDFTSKSIEKGIQQEELGITLLSLEKKIWLTKNTVRLNNDFITGEPDCFVGKAVTETKHGYDIKCSYSLWTFPFEETKLDKGYYWQDMGYMALTGADRWTTAYCLVNATGEQITREKTSLYYAMGMPDDSNERYMEKRREIEKNMIFDMAQFVKDNPGYDLDIKDWTYDIPRNERIKEFTVVRDELEIQSIYDDVARCREYMNKTYGGEYCPIHLASTHDTLNR